MGVNDKMVAPTCRSFLEKGNKNREKVLRLVTSLVNVK